MTTLTPTNIKSATTTGKLSEAQQTALTEHTKRFESAMGGEEYTPAPAPSQLSQDLSAMQALFQASLKK